MVFPLGNGYCMNSGPDPGITRSGTQLPTGPGSHFAQPPRAHGAHEHPHLPPGITVDDVGRFEEIQLALGELRFPISRETLIDTAQTNGSRDAVVIDLRSLPHGAQYGSWADLLVAMGVGLRH